MVGSTTPTTEAVPAARPSIRCVGDGTCIIILFSGGVVCRKYEGSDAEIQTTGALRGSGNRFLINSLLILRCLYLQGYIISTVASPVSLAQVCTCDQSHPTASGQWLRFAIVRGRILSQTHSPSAGSYGSSSPSLSLSLNLCREQEPPSPFHAEAVHLHVNIKDAMYQDNFTWNYLPTMTGALGCQLASRTIVCQRCIWRSDMRAPALISPAHVVLLTSIVPASVASRFQMYTWPS